MTRFWVVALNAIGFAVVALCSRFYRQGDQVAFGILALIACGLLGGTIELWRRLNGQAARRRGVEALKQNPQGPMPEALKDWSEAALQGRPLWSKGLDFTTYLIGLVVLFGMLGTFLGLVETLSGARSLLTSNPDLESLRAGLLEPFAGLTRAFGTSIAGVSASGALGLSAVLVRRDADRVRQQFLAFVSHDWRDRTPEGQQQEALALLTQSSQLWPKAAETLGKALEKIELLGAKLDERSAQQKGASEALQKALVSQLERGINEGLLQSISQFADAMEQRAERSAERTLDVLKQGLDENAQALTARMAAFSEALQARLDAGLSDLSDRLCGTLQQSFSSMASAFANEAQAQTAALQTLPQTLQTELHALSLGVQLELQSAVLAMGEAEKERTAAAQSELRTASAQALQQMAAFEAEIHAEWHQIDEAFQARMASNERAQAEQRALEDAAQAERHEAFKKAFSVAESAFGDCSEALRAVPEQIRMQSEAQLLAMGQKMEAFDAALLQASSRVSADFEGVMRASGEASEASARAVQAADQAVLAVERVSMALEGVAQKTGASLAEVQAALADRLQQWAADQVALFEEKSLKDQQSLLSFGERWAKAAEEGVSHLGEALVAPLSEVIALSKQAPEAASKLIEAASARWADRDLAESCATSRLLDAVSALDAMAKALSCGENQRDETLSQHLAAFDEAQQKALQGYVSANRDDLEALRSLWAEDREATMQLLKNQEQSAEIEQRERLAQMAKTWSEQGDRMADALQKCAEAVAGAGELLEGGGAEFAAVVALFTEAVDAHREAVDRWMTQASEQRPAASGNSGGYMEQVCEMLGETVQVQREMFDEIKTMQERR